MTSTLERLAVLLAKDYSIAHEKLTLDAPLDGLGIDSLGVAELLFNLEDEFKVTVPPEPVQMTTLGDVVSFIDALVTAQRGSAIPAAPAGLAAAASVVG